MGAETEDLDRVADVGEPVLAGDFGSPCLDFGALDFDGRAALPAHQVVMMLL